MSHNALQVVEPATLRGASRLLGQAARLALLGAWECDIATEKLVWTDGVFQLFELCPGSPLRRSSIVDFYVDESRATMEAMRAKVLATGRSCTGDLQIRTARGATRWMRLSIDLAIEAGLPVRLFGGKQDITLEHEAFVRLRQSAERDPLTGLANRAVFDQRYQAIVADTLNYSHTSALALIDLDRFKRINDTFGHLAGDECLRQFAVRLQSVFGGANLVARIGGDEFAVLLPASVPTSSIRQVLQRAVVALGKPVFWNGACFEVGASIGATIIGRPHHREASELLAEADRALYAAKAVGRNTVHVFGDDMLRADGHHAALRASKRR